MTDRSKPTLEEVAEAVLAIGDCVPGFPRGDVGQRVVAHSVYRFVSTREQLFWLVEAACNSMRRFSLQELRGIFCRRFPPADGTYAEAEETPGFTAADQERAYFEREARETEQKLLVWRRELKLLGTAPCSGSEVLALPPGANAMPTRSKLPAPEPRELTREERQAMLRYAEEGLREAVAHGPRRTEEEQQRLVAELEAKLKGRIVR
jgi:hypothetical protein